MIIHVILIRYKTVDRDVAAADTTEAGEQQFKPPMGTEVADV